MGLMYDYNGDGESPSVFHETLVKAAKLNHRCTECRGIIEAGQHYQRCAGVWDGSWSQYFKCKFCLAFESKMEEHYRGFRNGNDFGYMLEDARGAMRDLYSADHPGRWFSAARRYVAIRRNRRSQASRGVVDKAGRRVQ